MVKHLGSQVPTFQNIEETKFEYSKQIMSDESIAETLNLFGLNLLEWQLNILKKLLIGSEGEYKLHVTTLALLVPRQNGKSQLLIAYIIISLLMGRSGIYSSFLLSSAEDIFFRTQNFIANNKTLVKWFEFSSAKADTLSIEIKEQKNRSGEVTRKHAFFVFVTRGGNFGRGLTDLDAIIYDESQHVKESHINNVEAVVATSSAPQHIFMGTPALPLIDSKTGKASTNNDYFHSLKKSILSSNDDSKLWLEWSAPQVFEPDNEEIFARYNPSFMHDLGGGKRIRMPKTNSTNLNFSIERLGYQVQSSIYGETQLLLSDIINSSCWDKEKIEENFIKKGNYVLSIKSTINNSKIYIVKTSRSKSRDKYFTAVVNVIDNKKDSLAQEKLAEFIMQEFKKLPCKHIVVDGSVRNNVKNTLMQFKKWDSSKSSSTQGKVTFTPVSSAVEAAAVFVSKFNGGNVVFNENLKPTLDDLIPSIQRRAIGQGFGFISGTMDAELVECFALGVTEASKRL